MYGRETVRTRAGGSDQRPTQVEPPKDRHSAKSAKDHRPDRSGQASFPRAERLLKPSEFKRVFKNSTASTDRYFKVLGSHNGTNNSRLGMAVSRQVDKLAVGRNRIKRVVRESFRLNFNYLNSSAASALPETHTGIDLVILPRRQCATICNRQLFTSLEAHWLRINKVLARKKAATEIPAGQAGNNQVKQDLGKL